MCERILAQNCQKFYHFNFEFSMSHHNAHYQSYKNTPREGGGRGGGARMETTQSTLRRERKSTAEKD